MKVWLSCVCVILPFAGAPQAACAGSAVPRVLVTAEPLKPLADALLAGITHSESLMRPGQDAHTRSLSPSQVKALTQADLIILPDRRLNMTVSSLLDKANHTAELLVLSEVDGVAMLPYPTRMRWLEQAGETPKEPSTRSTDADSVDPHFWLDPLRMADLLPVMAESIIAISPSHAATIRRNAADLEMHLRRQVHPALMGMLADRKPGDHMRSRPFIPYVSDHVAYQYFLARFGLTDYGALHDRPEEIIGARSTRNVLKQASTVTIGCLIAEQLTPTVRRVAEASGADIRLHRIEDTQTKRAATPEAAWVKNGYDALLYRTAQLFADCLEK